MNRKQRKERDVATIVSIVRLVLVISLILVLIYGGLRAFFFLLPIVVGLILATASVATSKWVVKWCGKIPFIKPKPASLGKNRLQRGLSLIIYILLFIIMGMLFAFLVTFIIQILSTLSKEIPQWIGEMSIIDHMMREITHVSQRLGNFLNQEALLSIRDSLQTLQENAIRSIPQLVTRLLGILTGLFSSLPHVILVAVITVLSGYYFIMQTDRLYKLALRIVPDQDLVRKVFNLVITLTLTLFRIIGGYILLLIITFIEAYIGFLIIGIEKPLTWAIVAAIVDLFPILGISFTLLPMSIVYFVAGDTWIGIGLLILLIIMTILRRLFEPAIIGNAMQLHPLMTILSMIIGIASMGLGGILVGPLVFFVAREIYVSFGIEIHLRNMFGEMLAASREQPPEETSES